MPITEISAEVGISEQDVASWLVCVRHWMDKGLDFDAAIARHMEVMNGMLTNVVSVAQSAERGHALVINTFFPDAA